MMNPKLLRFASIAALVAFSAAGLHAEKKTFRDQLAEKLLACEYALEVVMSKPETAVPAQEIKEAKGIIIMRQVRAGLIFGGQGGSAVLICRVPQKGDEWGAPVFLDPGGVNFGLQAGMSEINTVILLNSDEAVRRAYSGRFDLGADAKAVAGPKSADKDNSDLMKAPVRIYTSLGGAYAGATLKTGWIKPFERANRELYRTALGTPEIAISTAFQPAPEAVAIRNRVIAAESGAVAQ
ncbi:MAG: lipid-binding SYLF domain-containing protein [Opitutaceae bacterium]|nr:lipid-binding SYLF domain-containing protein [Opitutaceae bacterium]